MFILLNLQKHTNLQKEDLDPFTRLESLRALTLSRFNHYRFLKPKDPKGVFSHPKNINLEDLLGTKTLYC